MDNKKNKKNLLIKIVCFIVSFGLWLYISNVENPSRSNKLSGVPVEIINVDSLKNSKLTILPGQDFKVTLTIDGPASEVYKAKPDQFKVVADLSDYAVKKGSNLIPISIVQYPTGINIKKNESLRVNIEIDELVEKSVPIKLELDSSTKPGYYSFDPVIKPDSALVSGAATYVNTVKWVIAKGTAKDQDADINLSLPLKAVDEMMKDVKDVDINPTSTEVFVPVRKSKNVAVKVKTKGESNKNIVIKSIEPSTGSIEILGEDKDISNIDFIETEPLDLATVTGNNDVTLKLAIPKGAKSVNGKDTVSVKITVEVINQNTLSIPITMTGLGEGLKAELSAKNVSVSLKGPDSILAQISEADVTATLDLTNLGEGEHNLSPKIVAKEGTSLQTITPEKIKVTITKIPSQ
ncbi:CdaR family protein [Clostridium amazonitimonense]|uniref:CdaR family protein n=1 Tax=Clostridium amazonitimonense TaxID=1499689 RepID=UPI000509DAEC|nr:CdaR family protein [Clostridium amazonitimonense]